MPGFETHEEHPRYPGWYRIKCYGCRGYGVVNAGYLEVVPAECSECNGCGSLWKHKESGAIAQWPGGPFVGRELYKSDNGT